MEKVKNVVMNGTHAAAAAVMKDISREIEAREGKQCTREQNLASLPTCTVEKNWSVKLSSHRHSLNQ